MRLFVAVYPGDRARLDLENRLAAIRHTPADRWHLTLAFLGEVADDRQPDIERALDGVAGPGPFSLRLAGAGRFGAGRSSATWAGVTGDLDALASLRAEVAAALAITDDRPFTAHLTVAYAGGSALERALAGYSGPSWTVSDFALVRSHYREGGGYAKLRCWPLHG